MDRFLRGLMPLLPLAVIGGTGLALARYECWAGAGTCAFFVVLGSLFWLGEMPR